MTERPLLPADPYGKVPHGLSRLGLDNDTVAYEDRRWIAKCQYHGVLAMSPDYEWSAVRWNRHVDQCVAAQIEQVAGTIIDVDGNETHLVIPIHEWRRFAETLQSVNQPATVHPDAQETTTP